MLKKYELQYSLNQKLEDVETLKDIMTGKVNMNSLNNELKIRLIDICSERLDCVEQRIEEKRGKMKFENASLVLSNKFSQGVYQVR